MRQVGDASAIFSKPGQSIVREWRATHGTCGSVLLDVHTMLIMTVVVEKLRHLLTACQTLYSIDKGKV